ncbi:MULTISPECIES: WhiB family transcriptional regulator [unclassified Nocardia]|uniref:WhiB family transcriptional regulator n=1 Tax=unclassified Nocardia TaxID=2637762 RepID=UPI00278C051F|nr:MULTISPECIES: WhiB family transcriptional regulator [unclassified Nocardia]
MQKFVAPQAGSESLTWPDRACVDLDPDLFFPEHDDLAAVQAAQRVCSGCPVLRQCAQWGRTAGITDGVVAAVLMPKSTASAQSKADARRKLARIAKGGRPILQRSTAQWGDPELQRQVYRLRGEGKTWTALTARLAISHETARKAFDAYNPAADDGSEAVA